MRPVKNTAAGKRIVDEVEDMMRRLLYYHSHDCRESWPLRFDIPHQGRNGFREAIHAALQDMDTQDARTVAHIAAGESQKQTDAYRYGQRGAKQREHARDLVTVWEVVFEEATARAMIDPATARPARPAVDPYEALPL